MRQSPSRLYLPAVLILLAAVGGACGQLKPDAQTGGAGSGGGGSGPAGASGGPILVTVSGHAAPHPLNAALGATEDFTTLKVAIVDPTATIVDPMAPPLASATLDTGTGNCGDAAGCAFSLTGVDIKKQTLGLVGSLEDQRPAASQLWVKTGTGMGTGAFLTEVRKAPAPIPDRRAFAVSRKLEAKLAAFVSLVLSQTVSATTLNARGYLIGHVVGKLSEGPTPAGVAGATVTPGGTAANAFDLIYPKADFSGAGTSTSASGIFLVVPKAAMPLVTSWDVVPPTGDARTWEQHLAGTNPGNAFVIILPANE